MANQEKFSRILVRCWPLQLPSADGHIENGHFIAYPDGFGGNDLFTCTGCGHLYAANIEMACLGPTLEEKIRGCDCVRCGGPLTALLQRYPESYLDSSLRLLKHVRGRIPPRDSDSIVREFDSI